MNAERYIERIEQYLEGEMSQAERAAFEAEIDENAELRQTMAAYDGSLSVIEQSIENNLRDQLQAWAAEDKAAQPAASSSGAKIVSMRTMALRWAAAASILLVIGWFALVQTGKGLSDEALFAAQYDLPQAQAALRGDAAEHPLASGAAAFDAGDFQTAQTLFEQISEQDEYYAEAQYLLGHIALQQKDYDRAIAGFNRAAERRDPKVSEKAAWNTLLAYIAAKRTDESNFKTLLAQIAGDAGHSYQQQAKTLQSQLADFRRKFV
jgi:TolA-binding protein